MPHVIRTDAAPPSFSAYAQAVETAPGERLVHVSGQVGVTLDGDLAEGAVAQHEQAWRNVLAVLEAAGMAAEDIVDVTAVVSDASGVPIFREVRDRMLGGHIAGSTLLVCGLASPDWLVEIKVMAAR